MKYTVLFLKILFGLSLFVSFVLCTMVVLCLFGCEQSTGSLEIPLFQTEKVVFSLPEYPKETHPELKGWLVCSILGGEVKTLKLDSSAKSVQLEVPKNSPVPLLCYPLSDGIESCELSETGAFFHPAGCVYPSTKEITWTGGFVAEILHQLLYKNVPETNRFLSLFNWGRLISLVNEKDINPWQLDKELIIKNISSGNFAARYVKAKEINTKQIILPESKKNLTETPQYLYSRYVPEPPLPVEQKDKSFFATVKLTVSGSPYSLNEENFFLWQGKVLKLPD